MTWVMVQLGYTDTSSYASEPLAGDENEAFTEESGAQGSALERMTDNDSTVLSSGASGDVEAQASGAADRAVSLAHRHPHSRLLSTPDT